MCFSATASFAAGTALSATGGVTLKTASKKSEIPFAAIPLVFGVQQIVEGGVWLSFKYGTPLLNQLATYGFLFFAYLFWPIFVPYSIGKLEADPDRKRIIRGFLFLGIAVSLYLLYFLVSRPISSHVLNQCIAYTRPTEFGVIPVVFYWIATCISCFFSGSRIINFFGALGTVSLALAYYFYTSTFISVWCFFAAVLSVVVYWYFKKTPEKIDGSETIL